MMSAKISDKQGQRLRELRFLSINLCSSFGQQSTVSFFHGSDLKEKHILVLFTWGLHSALDSRERPQ